MRSLSSHTGAQFEHGLRPPTEQHPDADGGDDGMPGLNPVYANFDEEAAGLHARFRGGAAGGGSTPRRGQTEFSPRSTRAERSEAPTPRSERSTMRNAAEALQQVQLPHQVV